MTDVPGISLVAMEHATAGRWTTHPSDETCRGVSIDTREPLAGRCYVAIRGERFDGHDFIEAAIDGGATALMVEAEVDAPSDIGVLRVPSTRHALLDLAAWHRQRLRQTIVVGITGSVGKTTTRSMIDATLSFSMSGTSAIRSFNNDIGVPLTLLRASPSDAYVLVEIGMNAPGEIDRLGDVVQPDVVVLTRLGRAHLEGVGDLDTIAAEKASLLQHLRPDGRVYANIDAPEIRHHLPGDAITFGMTSGSFVPEIRDASLHDVSFTIGDETVFSVPLPGRHNATNAIPSILLARSLGVPDAAIAAGLARATVPPMRMDVREIGPVTVCNDAYNANPDSATASIETFCDHTPAGRRIVILGDMLELGEDAAALHREVGEIARDCLSPSNGDRLILIGSLAAEAMAVAPGAICFDSMDQPATDGVAAMLRPGDHVLLKGSRGARLEQLIPAIETWAIEQRPSTAASER